MVKLGLTEYQEGSRVVLLPRIVCCFGVAVEEVADFSFNEAFGSLHEFGEVEGVDVADDEEVEDGRIEAFGEFAH